MAATKFYSEFADELGDTWRINIIDTDYTGAASVLPLAVDGFTLRYNGDNQDKFQPILGSSVTFVVFNRSSDFETFLNTTIPGGEEGQFLVDILKDPGDPSEELWWRGVLLTEQIEQLDEPQPSPVQLTASDDLAHLDKLTTEEFDDITLPNTSIAAFIWGCFAFTRQFVLYGTTDSVLRYFNDIQKDGYTGSNYLNDTAFFGPAVYDENSNSVKYPTILELLRSLAITFNARVFQAQGKWWFLPLNVLKRRADGDSCGVDFNMFGTLKNRSAETINFAAQLAFNSEMVEAINSTNVVKMAGGTITYSPGVKKVSRRRLYKGNSNIWFLGDFDATFNATGAQLSFADNDIVYYSGQTFTVELSTQMAIAGTGVAENPANNYILRADITLQIGTQYLTNSGWSSSAGEYSIVIAQWQYGNGLDIGTGYISIETDGLPSDQTGLDASIRYRIFNGFGSEQTSAVTVDFLSILFRGLYGEVGQGPGDSALYSATTSLNNQVEILQDNVITGGVSVNWYSGNFDVGESFVSSQTATAYPIHRLGVREVLAYNQLPTQVKRGTLYAKTVTSYVHPFTLLQNGSDYYALHEFEYSANRREYSLERWLLDNNFSNITLPVVDVENDNPQADYGASVGNVANKLATDLERITTGEGTVIQQVIRVDHSSGSTYTVDTDDTNGFMYMNRWVDTVNGTGTIYLPKVADNEGRMLRFKSDDSISANENYDVSVDNTEYTNGVRIDGQRTFSMARPYDGIMVLCYNNQWYVIQRKSK